MGSLQKMKEMVAEMFNKAQNKEDIETLSQLSNVCDEVEAEHNKLQTENKDLMKDYKELIKHTSFKDPNNKPSETIGGVKELNIDEALAQAIKDFRK